MYMNRKSALLPTIQPLFRARPMAQPRELGASNCYSSKNTSSPSFSKVHNIWCPRVQFQEITTNKFCSQTPSWESSFQYFFRFKIEAVRGNRSLQNCLKVFKIHSNVRFQSQIPHKSQVEWIYLRVFRGRRHFSACDWLLQQMQLRSDTLRTRSKFKVSKFGIQMTLGVNSNLPVEFRTDLGRNKLAMGLWNVLHIP